MGDWVRGPFANATIEGFIYRELEDAFEVIVKKITVEEGPMPLSLTYGSTQTLPKLVIRDFYIQMNMQQQQSLIYLAKQLKDRQWIAELMDQFHNPFLAGSSRDRERELVYSSIFDQFVSLSKKDKRKLFAYYQEAVKKGLSNRYNYPEDLNNSEALDVAISSIVLVSKDAKGIEFVKNLKEKSW